MEDMDADAAKEALNAKLSALQKEKRRALLQGSAAQGYKDLTKEMEVISSQLGSIREADTKIQSEIVKLNAEVQLNSSALDAMMAALKLAEETVEKARGSMLALKTLRVFPYPETSSIPPLGFASKDTCAYRGLGFIGKAAVLSSCGCLSHPPCVADLIAGRNYRCRVLRMSF